MRLNGFPRLASWMSCKPCEALALDVSQATLPYGIGTSPAHRLDDVGTVVGGDALYPDAEALHVPQV